MSPLAAIAWQTMRAHARSRWLRVAAMMSLLSLCGSHLLARLTIGNYDRTILDIGSSTIEIMGVALAIAVGSSVGSSATGPEVATPIDARPPARVTRLLGGYLGFLGLWSATASAMLVLLGVLLHVDGVALSQATLCATLLLYTQGAVISAIALLTSAVTTRGISVVLSLLAFLAGHSVDGIALLDGHGAGMLRAAFALVLRHVIPNLELFNLKAQAASRLDVSLAFTIDASLYGACYAGALLALACLAPSRRVAGDPKEMTLPRAPTAHLRDDRSALPLDQILAIAHTGRQGSSAESTTPRSSASASGR
jgi:hypothetical protein